MHPLPPPQEACSFLNKMCTLRIPRSLTLRVSFHCLQKYSFNYVYTSDTLMRNWANSEYPIEMQHDAAFREVLNCSLRQKRPSEKEIQHLCYVCLVFVMLSRLFIAALWPPAGKGLSSWLSFVMFYCVFVTFQ